MCVATRDGDNLTVFILHRAPAPGQLNVVLDGPTRLRVLAHEVLDSPADTRAINTAAAPATIRPRPVPTTVLFPDNTLTLSLPAHSWHCLRLTAASTANVSLNK